MVQRKIERRDMEIFYIFWICVIVVVVFKIFGLHKDDKQ